jgi:hypothetical protein
MEKGVGEGDPPGLSAARSETPPKADRQHGAARAAIDERELLDDGEAKA